MVFVAPAVHYSALTTVLAEPSTWKSQATIPHTASVRQKLNQIFKRLLHSDDLHERVTFPKGAHPTPFSTATTHSDRKTDEASMDNKSTSDHQHTSVEEVSTASVSSLMSPLERLPFTEPYFSVTSNNENHPFDLSAYHKHCIHQENFIARKQYHAQASSTHEHSSTLTTCRLGNVIAQQHHQTIVKCPVSDSTINLPASSSSNENRRDSRHAARGNNRMVHSQSLRSSVAIQQPTRLRRLQSRSKMHLTPSRARASLSCTSSSSTSKTPLKRSSASLSIAHRIELLKQAMLSNQLQSSHHVRTEHAPGIKRAMLAATNRHTRETQTDDEQVASSPTEYVHYHHIHSSSLLSLEWRSYLSVVRTLCTIGLFLIVCVVLIF